MENKYFTPDIEDIRFGYECEIQREVPKGLYEMMTSREPSFYNIWEKVIVGKELERSSEFTLEYFQKLMNELHYPNPSVEKCKFYIDHLKLRTPYLTKEQIEAEGWKYKGKTQDIWFEKEMDYDMGSWTAYKIVMQYGLDDKRLRIFAVDRVDKMEYDCFRGECKDINTFRYICKLLNIN